MIARLSCTVRAAASRASARTDRLTRSPLTTIVSMSSAVLATNARNELQPYPGLAQPDLRGAADPFAPPRCRPARAR